MTEKLKNKINDEQLKIRAISDRKNNSKTNKQLCIYKKYLKILKL